MPSLQPIIYNITNDSISEKYKLDLGKYWPSNETFTKMAQLPIYESVKELTCGKYAIPMCFQESNDYLTIYFICGKSSYLYIYNKIRTKSKLYSTTLDDFGYPVAIESNLLYVTDSEDSSLLRIYNLTRLFQ